jgi:3-hydroxyisobutyrate dehydrogenase
VRDAAIVQMCLLDDRAVEEVVFGPGGVCEAAGPDKILVDHSTISAPGTRRMAEALKTKTGMRWVDAPVTGGAIGGRNGTLIIFAGGEREDVEAVAPVMKHLSRRFIHMGPQGAGQATKATNQIGVACIYCVIAEMFTMARSQGARAEALPEALEGGFADSRLLQALGPKMAAGDFSPVGQIKTMLKDLRILEQLAAASEVPVPMAALATQLYRLHMRKGFGEMDITSVIKLYEA